MDVHGHDAWGMSAGYSLELTGKYPVCFGCLSVKFMCLVLKHPDVTNDSAHAELGLFCLPQSLNTKLTQEEEEVDWNAVLPSETPLQSH